MSLNATQKMDFIRKTKTETILLDEILIPLFTNMDKFKVVKTHGANENGKDIVLISDGPLNKKQYTGVIVKNESITNASTSRDKEIVATVSTQIVMCIDSGYSSIEEGKTAHFNDLLIITSQSVSNSARNQLVEIAEQHRFTNISFWETKEIVEYIDKYLPEIYLVSSGTLSKYFHILKEKCENLNELKKISIYKGEDKRLSEVYIEPKLFSKKEKIQNNKTVNEYLDTTLTRLLQKKGHYLITGSAGSGKSTLLRSEMYRMVLDYENQKRKDIPIFIKIKNLAKYPIDSDYMKMIKQYLCDDYQLSVDEVTYLFNHQEQIIFFFDGFDELSTSDEKECFFQVIKRVEECYGCTIVITTRKVNIVANETFSSYEKWDLADFNIKQIAEFFQKWFKQKNEKLIADLKDHDLLDKLPNTPLVMTLIAILFESDDNVEIPANLSELYRMFVDLLIGRWNLDRKIDSFYKANDKETFLTELALFLHGNNKLSCTDEELLKVFGQTAKDLGRTFDFAKLIDEIIKDTNLLIKNENGEFEFRHLSFQEYLVGAYLTINNEVDSIINKFPNPWWDQVLYFYCGTRKMNDDILPKIFNTLSTKEKSLKMLGIFEFGYLVQSSYKTKASIRMELIAKCIVEFTSTIQKYVSEADEDTKKMPEIIRYLSYIELFKTHFNSKYLEEIYISIYEEMRKIKYENFEQALALFILTTIVAANGKLEVLSDCDYIFKEHPLLLLMEDFQIRCKLMGSLEDKEQLDLIKERSRIIAKRIRNNRPLYKSLLE
jgi:NACHT domain